MAGDRTAWLALAYRLDLGDGEASDAAFGGQAVEISALAVGPRPLGGPAGGHDHVVVPGPLVDVGDVAVGPGATVRRRLDDGAVPPVDAVGRASVDMGRGGA